MKDFRTLLVETCSPYCGLNEEQIARLVAHYELLAAWNQRLNLTRIIEPGLAVRRHYLEGLIVAGQLPSQPLEILDFGSGAGFPGVPIAVARPDCSVKLVESHQRKAVFLREATREWGNVTVFSGRGEQIRPGKRADWVVSRAVRWQDVVKADLGENYALLLGKADAEAISRDAKGFTWNIVDSPGFTETLLAVGVPRGTSKAEANPAN